MQFGYNLVRMPIFTGYPSSYWDNRYKTTLVSILHLYCWPSPFRGIVTQQTNKMQRVHNVGFLVRFTLSLVVSRRGATYNDCPNVIRFQWSTQKNGLVYKAYLFARIGATSTSRGNYGISIDSSVLCWVRWKSNDKQERKRRGCVNNVEKSVTMGSK